MAERIQGKATSGMIEWLQIQRTAKTYLADAKDSFLGIISLTFPMFSFESSSGFTDTYGTTRFNTAPSAKRFK